MVTYIRPSLNLKHNTNPLARSTMILGDENRVIHKNIPIQTEQNTMILGVAKKVILKERIQGKSGITTIGDDTKEALEIAKIGQFSLKTNELSYKFLLNESFILSKMTF